MKPIVPYVALIVMGICGCSKSNDDAAPIVVSESKFLISNTNASGSGVISTYKKPDEITVDPAYTLSTKQGIAETIADFQIYNGKVYIARALSALIEVVNLNDFSQSQTITYAKPIANNVYKHIGVTNNKIFIGDR